MQLYMQIVSLTVFSLILICSEFKFTSGMELSRTFHDFKSPEADTDTERIKGTDSDVDSVQVQRRTCNGFPCMYSHLGSKAGRASLYKTLASFIDECFNNPNCDPGRRKRQSPSTRIQQLIDIPLYKLVQWRMRNDD